MPVTNIQGQNSTIELPMPSNVTDAEVSKSRRDAALKNAPVAAIMKHVREMVARYQGSRQVNTNRITAAQERKGDAKFHLANLKRDHDKFGTKVPKEAAAEWEEIIREADEEITACSKRKFPILDMDEIAKKASSVRNWPPHTKTYFVGDDRHPDHIRKDAKKFRMTAEDERDKVQQANRHSDDAIASMMADLRAHANEGKPQTAGHLIGFVVDARGRFQPNRNSKTEYPEKLSKPNPYSEDLCMTDDALNFLIFSNFEAVADALKRQILEESNDEEAIRDADRPALLAKAEAELLAAQRAEEYANKLCERAGIPVFRPGDWPIHVLLEVEQPSRAAVAKPATSNPDAGIVPADEADFEDDAADA